MSTIVSHSNAPLGSRPASVPAHMGIERIRNSARGLSILLLAAVVAGLVVAADRLIDIWADEQLFMAWVVLWAVVFAGMALFAGTARSLARRAAVSLDGWSQTLAEARAEARLWDLARADPRLMKELIAARTHQESELEAPVAAAAAQTSFAEALAPLSLPETPKAADKEDSYWVRVGMARARRQLAYYY